MKLNDSNGAQPKCYFTLFNLLFLCIKWMAVIGMRHAENTRKFK